MLNYFVELARLGVRYSPYSHTLSKPTQQSLDYIFSEYAIGLSIVNIIIIYHRVEDK